MSSFARFSSAPPAGVRLLGKGGRGFSEETMGVLFEVGGRDGRKNAGQRKEKSKGRRESGEGK